ncbi:RNA dependent RNA polymerase [Sphaeropsis sapinea RNA virus 2]|uniref:RNA-directed RNA polymerase n=1 Tax=Sphaeropsis sapinea RNA virus 2 TaxID=73498 RepID=Q9YXE4_9VIRU|nr:RNA dependent RNA polymerase [Sphaeropsis sapinea RNA virus 2]AAD11603.1 RNA dependent RNA polymerase [Sphaeropsis sapinea RNA virus 2]
MSNDRLHSRVEATGPVGVYLRSLVPLELAAVVSRLPFDRQISFIYSPQWQGRRPTGIQRLAGAFLLPQVPVQVSVTDADLLLLLTNTLPPAFPKRIHRQAGWSYSDRATLAEFGLKSNPAASNKVNVYLCEVMRSLSDYSTSWAWLAEDALSRAPPMFNDQASALVLYGTALQAKGVQNGYHAATALIANPEYAKDMTTVLKAVGANSNHLGACLVEAQTLQGRAVQPADMHSEAISRTTTAVADIVVDYPDDVLRSHIRTVLEREIQRVGDSHAIEYPTLQEHWDSRWLWAVNGSQSGLLSREHLEAAPRPPGAAREYRAVMARESEQDPRPAWDGHTYVSGSPKLEHGKTRAIFACDTLNYLAFEHLLASVESRWRGERVVLNPGRGGNVGMSFRVAAARQRAGISLMLDYDDFNSHHSIRAMQILFEETAALTHYPPELAAKLVASFENMDLYLGSSCIGRVLGTLMSGRRGTTYISSVLNEVYLAIELGASWLAERPSIHVGDDVYLGVRTYRDAAYVLDKCATSRLRMNPMKQSVGHTSTEFLRLACAGRATYGYLARAVASTISGNWVTEEALDPYDGLTSMLTNARSLANRASSPFLPLLLRRSVQRITKLPRPDHKKIDQLLTGQLALENGPMFSQGAEYVWVDASSVQPPPDEWGYQDLPLAATTQFLSRCAQPLEVKYLTEAGIGLTAVMAEASYRKTFSSTFSRSDRVILGPVRRRPVAGTASVERLLNTRPPEGCLEKYPLLRLARRRLPRSVLQRAIAEAGGNPDAADLDLEAWGEHNHGCVVATPLSYADAATYGRRTTCGVLVCGLHFYV